MNILGIRSCDISVKLMLWFSIAVLIIAAKNAWAADNDMTMVTNVMCAAINQLTGPIGRAITIIIVISLGIMLLLGKVTWGVAIALAVGMGVIFGARDVVNILSGGTGAICS
ncbi:MAG: TrbC/VirB2 family protein [Candidatus Midichloria sp.]|nr:TrbC/VirB2 family protein [Candidatus Midichloria sp.]MDJ1305764.1 TrbC/VirB2 family protein [Candidatus Midichloria sp.]